MKNKEIIRILLAISILLTGCKLKDALAPKSPITLTLWHNFGGQMQATMDEQIATFNATIGRERGIIVSVTSISSSSSLQQKLSMIASGEPGAPEMPDLTTCYPATATLLANKGLLTPLDGYFTSEELGGYLPRFLEEGRILAGQLYVFPIAKSTEVLFLNQTLFERFAQATGVALSDLSTLEEITSTALTYYNWSDGQAFFAIDSVFNLALVGMVQLGSSLIQNENVHLDAPEFEHILTTLLEPAIKGGLAIYRGYSSDLAKTGDVLCSTGSTAGILFYGSEITYPDNTKEEVEYSVLPYPIWSGGQRIAMQRGGGFVVAKSNPKKEEAAAVFLKWFTSPKQNMQFVTSTGYLPVTKSAFADHIEEEIALNHNPNVQKLLRTAMIVYGEYDFLIPPVFERFNAIQDKFEARFFQVAENQRLLYLENLAKMEPDAAYEIAIKEALTEFRAGQF